MATYAETHDILCKAKDNNEWVVIDVNEGEFTLNADNALEWFEEWIAPGEPFDVLKVIPALDSES